jgi:hypothetical protein
MQNDQFVEEHNRDRDPVIRTWELALVAGHMTSQKDQLRKEINFKMQN